MEESLVFHYVVTVLILLFCSVLKCMSYIGFPVGNVTKSTIEHGSGVCSCFFSFFGWLVLLSDGSMLVSKQHIHAVSKHV